MRDTAQLYGVSEDTLYRILRNRLRPRAVHRADRGQPRVMARAQLERYCELIAALKLRTSNMKGRHLSTAEAIRLVETYGGRDTGGPCPSARVAADEDHGESLSQTLGLRPHHPAEATACGPLSSGVQQ